MTTKIRSILVGLAVVAAMGTATAEAKMANSKLWFEGTPDRKCGVNQWMLYVELEPDHMVIHVGAGVNERPTIPVAADGSFDAEFFVSDRGARQYKRHVYGNVHGDITYKAFTIFTNGAGWDCEWHGKLTPWR
jgi:hypothetical protein